MVVLMIVESI